MPDDQMDTDVTDVTDVKTVTDDAKSNTDDAIDAKTDTDVTDDAKSNTDGDKSLIDREPDGAPEAYEDFSFPEGVEIDSELLTEATDIFKESGLKQDQAQKLVDFHSKTMRQVVEAQQAAFDQQVAEWENAATKHTLSLIHI